MKKKIAGIVAVLMATLMGGAVTSPANAGHDTYNCAQLVEWNQVEIGDRRTRVHKVLGAVGVVYAYDGTFEEAWFEKCASHAEITLGYVKQDGVFKVYRKDRW